MRENIINCIILNFLILISLLLLIILLFRKQIRSGQSGDHQGLEAGGALQAQPGEGLHSDHLC